MNKSVVVVLIVGFVIGFGTGFLVGRSGESGVSQESQNDNVVPASQELFATAVVQEVQGNVIRVFLDVENLMEETDNLERELVVSQGTRIEKDGKDIAITD